MLRVKKYLGNNKEIKELVDNKGNFVFCLDGKILDFNEISDEEYGYVDLIPANVEKHGICVQAYVMKHDDCVEIRCCNNDYGTIIMKASKKKVRYSDEKRIVRVLY